MPEPSLPAATLPTATPPTAVPPAASSAPAQHPRTTLLPPAPGRHHWCVVLPPSTLFHFDGPGAGLHAELVEALWKLGIGCARFDLTAAVAGAVPSMRAGSDHQLTRASSVLELIRRMDSDAEVTLLASGDAVGIAVALEQLCSGPCSGSRNGSPWPLMRGLLLIPAAVADEPQQLRRHARDLARVIAEDERPRPPRRHTGARDAGRQLLRRLGW